MAILTPLFRIRWAVLALLVLGAAAGGYAGFRDGVPPDEGLILAAIAFVLATGVAFFHFRHVGMAVVTVLAPCMGMVAAGLAARGLAMPVLLAIYGAGCIAAALTGGEIVRRVLTEGIADAAKLALARLFLPTLLAALAGAAVLAAWLFRVSPALAVRAAVLLIVSIASGVVVTAFAASVLPFGEGFFTLANRVREWRETALRGATRIVEPRWALSMSGIALVLAVLGWFGAAPFLGHAALFAKPALWGASGLSVFLLSFAAGRDWREALAALLALAALALPVLWMWGAAIRHLPPMIEILTVLTAAYLPMLVLIDGRRRFFAAGDESAVARLRALEDLGASAYFATATAVAAMLPWIVPSRSAAMLAAAFLLAGGAAILVQPALATTLEWFAPRRRSLKQLYGRG